MNPLMLLFVLTFPSLSSIVVYYISNKIHKIMNTFILDIIIVI